jgi:hypothetical protein
MTTAKEGKTDSVVDFDVALIERARKGDSRASNVSTAITWVACTGSACA